MNVKNFSLTIFDQPYDWNGYYEYDENVKWYPFRDKYNKFCSRCHGKVRHRIEDSHFTYFRCVSCGNRWKCERESTK